MFSDLKDRQHRGESARLLGTLDSISCDTPPDNALRNSTTELDDITCSVNGKKLLSFRKATNGK